MASSYLPSDYQREREREREGGRTVSPVSCFQTHGSISTLCIFQRPLGPAGTPPQLVVSDLIEPSYTEDTAENLLSLPKTSFLAFGGDEFIQSHYDPRGINYSASVRPKQNFCRNTDTETVRYKMPKFGRSRYSGRYNHFRPKGLFSAVTAIFGRNQPVSATIRIKVWAP